MRRGLVLIAAWLSLGAVADEAPASTCPTDDAAAAALFAESTRDEATALALTACPQTLAVEAGLATLGDVAKPRAATLQAIVGALDDPRETVRREALVAMMRQRAAIGPLLAYRTFGGERSRYQPILSSDPAALFNSPWAQGVERATVMAAALALLGKKSALPLTVAAPWDGMIGMNAAEPVDPARLPLGGERALASPSINGRMLYLRGLCPMDAMGTDGADGDALLCPAPTAGMTWLARHMADRELANADFALFEGLLRHFHVRAVKARTTQMHYISSPSPGVRYMIAYGEPPSSAALPAFPWPAPRPVKSHPVALSSLGNPATLGQLADTLRQRIAAVDSGFDIGLFSGPPGGFVLVTRLERIDENGKPFPPPHRFTQRGSPKVGFWQAVAGLLGEKPGYFRIIAFVVADDVAINAATPATAIPLDAIGQVTRLPAAMANQPVGQRKVTAFVYAFKRAGNGPRQNWTTGAPSAADHLRASGLGARLGL